MNLFWLCLQWLHNAALGIPLLNEMAGKGACLQFVSPSYCSLSVSFSVIFAFITVLTKYVYLREESNLCNNFIQKKGGRLIFEGGSIFRRLSCCLHTIKHCSLFYGKALHMYPSCLFGDLFVTKNSVGLSLVRWATYVWEESVEPHLPKHSKPKCYLSTAHAYNIT